MKNWQVFLVCIFCFAFIISVFVCDLLNQEANLRISIEAHERDREASFDTMKKIIEQQTQLPRAAREDLLKLLPEIISGRTGGNIFKVVQEKYPKLTLDLYGLIGRSIESERHVFLREQKELFDVKREHDSLLNSVPGGTICKFFGRHSVEVKVISSTAAKETMQTSVDDDTQLNFGD